MNQNWFNNKIFAQFLQSYSNANEFNRNKTNIFYTYLEKFNRVSQTSFLAHRATLNHLNHIESQDSYQHRASLSNENDIEFEINEDVLKFYHKSRKFKREKQQEEIKRLKGINEGTLNDYISGEQSFKVKMDVDQASKYVPLEKPGSKREQELKILYGSSANIIHLNETKLQMKYDLNLDLYQPKYWPSFPLKIKFN